MKINSGGVSIHDSRADYQKLGALHFNTKEIWLGILKSTVI